MNKKTTGIVAGVAGGALLMGGATFALWQDQATVAGETLTAGNLEVSAIDQTWQDVSAPAAPRDIELSKFHIVPGDKILGTFTIDASLVGDNMFADLTLPDLSELVGDGGLGDGLDVVAHSRISVDGVDHVLFDNQDTVHFASKENPNRENWPVLGEDSEIEVTVQVTFPSDTENRDYATQVAALEDLSVTLKQVRG